MIMIPEIDLHKYYKDKEKTSKIIDLFIDDMFESGHSTVRIIHGKGKGDFRKMIHSYLEKHESVVGYTLCDSSHGGSGATFVHLGKSDKDRKKK
ncbi:Smr/MutS family protein [bacterium]|nr:Smr/MutS family protein [bacterium]MBU1025483.1 Smr/MutS family protein [bacterium]